MEILHVIILLFSTTLPLFGAVLSVISKYIKSFRAKKALEGLVRINNVIGELMIEAEQFVGYGGLEKKGYVLSCAKSFAAEHEIAFNEEAVSKTIEELINLSKNVNPKAKKTNKKNKEEKIGG